MAQMGFLPTLSPTRSPGAEQVLTVGFLSAVGEGGADTQSGDWKRWLGLRGGAGGQLGWRGRGARLRGEPFPRFPMSTSPGTSWVPGWGRDESQ